MRSHPVILVRLRFALLHLIMVTGITTKAVLPFVLLALAPEPISDKGGQGNVDRGKLGASSRHDRCLCSFVRLRAKFIATEFSLINMTP